MVDHRTKNYRSLARQTPRTNELLSEKIDGQVYEYKKVAKCKVCSAPDEVRKLVDTLLLYPKSYRETLEFARPLEDALGIEEKERVSYDSIRTHQKRHLPLDKKAVREIIERRAADKGRSVLETKDSLLTLEGLLEVIVTKGFDQIVKGTVTPTLNQTMYAAQALEKLEKSENQQFRPEALIAQLNTIVQAMREVLPPEMRQAVLDRIDELQSGFELEASSDDENTEEAEWIDADLIEE